MKQITNNTNGSVYPIFIFIAVLAIASFMGLLYGQILEPFFNLMSDNIMKDFLKIVFPYGIAFFILIVMIFTLIMEMQKKKYKEGYR